MRNIKFENNVGNFLRLFIVYELTHLLIMSKLSLKECLLQKWIDESYFSLWLNDIVKCLEESRGWAVFLSAPGKGWRSSRDVSMQHGVFSVPLTYRLIPLQFCWWWIIINLPSFGNQIIYANKRANESKKHVSMFIWHKRKVTYI